MFLMKSPVLPNEIYIRLNVSGSRQEGPIRTHKFLWGFFIYFDIHNLFKIRINIEIDLNICYNQTINKLGGNYGKYIVNRN